MIMKKIVLTLAVASAFSSVAAQAKSDWYIGVDVLNSNLDIESNFDLDSATGVGISAGRNIKVNDNFSIDIEAEYIHLGNFTNDNGAYCYSNYNYVRCSSDVDMDAFNLNVKPKYHFNGSGLYLGAIAGLTSMTADGIVYSHSVGYTNSYYTANNVEGFGYNYGLELGYEFNTKVIISVGYRVASVDFDVKPSLFRTKKSVNFETQSAYIGLDYKF
ncbi:hypothetical protein VAZ01S_006_00090 [Vibrio azureus NBRC 104587]|uniref:Outer membrane protein beta-barrel domain-containing protein n=3 Tax=Vibrio azureus TaxID=512649 RepID=U3A2M3_9VIBR|nr:hypothetical protein VAZ01S_006_00090 [Vibrio azureus NBRC 104587]